ncbi:MAG: RidA family protein [Phycisphaerales bacterium]|jgi:enamine deaminase RidA (YjgF/YER057c/UK114 family)
MSIEATLTELGLSLPPAPKPAGAYIPTRRSGNLVFVAGQIPMAAGQMIATGSVPGAVSMEVAQRCAVQCVLNGLAAIKAELGSLEAVKQFVRLGVFVCSEAGFTEQPKVANAASELLVKLFGEKGKHARAAVGSVALPLGAPVEIEFVVEA